MQENAAKSASTLNLSAISDHIDNLFEIDHESIEVPPKKQKPASAKRKSSGLIQDTTVKKNVLLTSFIEVLKQPHPLTPSTNSFALYVIKEEREILKLF